jgi:hypothetical protein
MADESNKGTSTPAIDETPISPSSPNAQRKNSLEKHLANRPDKAELVQSMIFYTRPSPSFTPNCSNTIN